MDTTPDSQTIKSTSFFDQPGIIKETLPFGPGIPLGLAPVKNPLLGIGGVYGSWGQAYNNVTLFELIDKTLGEPLPANEKMDLATLGFTSRHLLPTLSDEDHLAVELAVGVRVLCETSHANGWETDEVDAVLIGMSSPVSHDYLERICELAGIRKNALKVSIHKACDGSAAALHTALNPDLSVNNQLNRNIARELEGKKVIAGGIEGLSRFVNQTRDKNAMQFFGNGTGAIGVIPGQTIKFITGDEQEVYDEQGALAVQMKYPHSRQRDGKSIVEASESQPNSIRLAGLMHEPENNDPIAMASMMGMVKLFVRNGVIIVEKVLRQYQEQMQAENRPEKTIRTTIVHHANFKINSLKEKQLQNDGFTLTMPWLLSEFGNVSAASLMIAFCRMLPELTPGDHVLMDGFGAGSYYDVFVVEFPERR
jgi:3-oxoacyl-[acyl-carrier-protein] synthase III